MRECILCRRVIECKKVCQPCVVKVRRYRIKLVCVALLGGRCMKCGYSKCTRSLHFHHAQGDKEFNITSSHNKSWKKILLELEKCKLLCSNCHFEDHHIEEERFIKYVNNYRGGQLNSDNYGSSSRARKLNCVQCMADISTKKPKSMCVNCSSIKKRKVKDRPSKETLMELISDIGYSGVGRMYGVSDNSVRKWTK